MNGGQRAQTAPFNGPSSPPDFSDDGVEDDSHEDHGGDYSTRFDELMSDAENGTDEHNDDEDEEEAFFYNGVDADHVEGGYKEQLRDVLGPEHEDDELEEVEVERSLVHDVEENEKFAASLDDEARRTGSRSASPESHFASSPPTITVSHAPYALLPMERPFIHPAISRLRSVTPQASRTPSIGSFNTLISLRDLPSVSQSHFSALSRSSSTANIHESAATAGTSHDQQHHDVFRWTRLKAVEDFIYGRQPSKAAAILGTPSLGSPTVLTSNGLVCIGTDLGRILVFDFKQNLRCVCGDDPRVGPVTALALSFDHTYIATGHATGHIQLFELSRPKTSARFVAPTSLAAVAAGTQEGHLLGSRINSIGFVAGRHTAIVSADETGLAFYHSLGKVLFVEASDVLRILGKYPDEDPHELLGHAMPFRKRRMRKANTILSMSPLPLGTSPHPTDAYNLIALLTPVKLVIVGLKPSPKTWYRRHREADDEPRSSSRYKGSLAWFPSVIPGAPIDSHAAKKQNGSTPPALTSPMLVYSWGNTVNLIRVSETKVRQKSRNARTGKVVDVEVGRITFEEVGRWTTETDVLVIQWLNVNQVIILTSPTLEVYDIRGFSHTTNGSVSYADAITEVSHSLRVYKGKIFILGQHELKVGTLLTWADRILAFVERGDFLSAIDLTRSYYVGEAPGNRNGLPEDQEEYRTMVGTKLHELMVASARYAFSEERLYDATHVTPDGRGVDRTALFEGLVVSCSRACITLDDFDLLFEELYQHYEDNGIAGMFLLQLEPFVLDGQIRHVPPRITQRLVALHSEDNRPDLVERVIWHIDPDCLDINQAITLCQHYNLYDALIYVYTAALKDYVLPVVELFGLIRKVRRYRRARSEASPTSRMFVDVETVESDTVNAYKIFPYLADVLTGLSYPSEEPLAEEDAIRAKDDVYKFLFFGRSNVWPLEGGKLILTSDEENGEEPTYPYTRLLLRFDAESFLHTLDLAFEDSYLNDESKGVNRLVIVKVLFEILSTPGLSPSEATFLNIFIARNVPKYPQFIRDYMAPTELQSILIGLADSSDESTREDRQLAAEYLLSTYTPHDGDHLLRLFEQAGFYRILRTWHRQERQWVPLLETYVQDPDLPPAELFPSVDNVIQVASRSNKGTLPSELLVAIQDSISALLRVSMPRTAFLVDRRVPNLHDRVMEMLASGPARDRFLYLRSLLGSPQKLEEEFGDIPHRDGPSSHVPPQHLQEYVSLLCEFDRPAVIHELKYLPPDRLDWDRVQQTCEAHEAYDAVIWSLNHRNDPSAALSKAETYLQRISSEFARRFSTQEEEEDDIEQVLSSLQMVGTSAGSVCLERSQAMFQSQEQAEDLWFKVLHSQIQSLHVISIACPTATSNAPEPVQAAPQEKRVLEVLRSLVQNTFNSLLSINSSKVVSFPRLFKRLVDSATKGPASQGAVYNEFRVILSGMLDSYRSDGDMLVITKHMIDYDVFVAIESLAIERSRGWAPSRSVCNGCGERLPGEKRSAATMPVGEGSCSRPSQMIVSRTGAIYHDRCSPPDFHVPSSARVH
ncbi:unnamed protein product [Somion occarium]|uniref:Vacuolar protein sorting-associated protein 8 central domain-containing protein n=1 Tax=Somion occarium TaxID=3059160 RepID=A0ABP1DKQ1_9APHY